MTQIEKLVSFIEDVFNHAPSNRYEIKELETGTPILFDHDNRVRVVIKVQELLVSKYDSETGKLRDEIAISWHNLNRKQKQRIAELVDIPEDLDPEVEDTLLDILKGV